MTTAATSLLGLALPITGELSGTWGDTVNNQITSLLDSAVAGTTTISSDADVTLTSTTLAANEARQAVLLFTGARTALRTVTAPAHSKIYTLINSTTGGFSVKLVGSGPTTGVTVTSGEACMVAWNGSDFVKLSNQYGPGIFSSVTDSGLTSGRVTYATTSGLLTDSANLTFNGTTLATPTLNLTNALGVAYGGTGQTSYTDGQLLIGNSSGNTLSKATLTAGSNVTITNGNGTITIAAAGVSAATPSVAGTLYGLMGALSSNTFAGGQSGKAVTTGTGNTLFGNWVATNLTTGSSNIGIGVMPLGALVSGSRNIAIGNFAGSSNPQSDNIYIGDQAGTYQQGTYSIGIGTSALAGVSGTGGGNYNIAIGQECLYGITTGSQNVAMGYRAGYNNITDQNNVFVGYTSGYYTTGSGQTAIGSYAMNNMRGSVNTALGISAMSGSLTPANNTGTNNVAVGGFSLNTVSSGSYNTVSGYQAGTSITTGGWNTATGYLAGFNLLSGNGNTFIGYNAGYNIATSSNNVIIGSFGGNNAGLDIRNSSNNIVLSDGAGLQRWYIDSTGATGYPIGSGGTVTQATSRTTGVTLNKPTGAITLVSAAGSASYQTFTVTNSAVSATDTIIVNQKSGTDKYIIMVTAVATGSFNITFATTGGTTTEQPVFSFALIKGATA